MKFKVISEREGTCQIGDGASCISTSYEGILDIPSDVYIDKPFRSYYIVAIGNGAFKDCQAITAINIPEGVTRIGDNVFQGCSNLSSLSLPTTVSEIGTGAFRGCSNLVSVIIPNKVDIISDETFMDCVNLSNLTIPEGVTRVGDSVFSGCTSLANITFPESIVHVGQNYFINVPWYINQPDGMLYIGKCAYKYKGTMPNNTEITLREGITEIAPGAFSGCAGLSSIS